MYWQMVGNSVFVVEKLHPDFTVEICVKSIDIEPLKDIINRCAPGGTVVFDNVQVTGPDNILHTIEGLSLMLH